MARRRFRRNPSDGWAGTLLLIGGGLAIWHFWPQISAALGPPSTSGTAPPGGTNYGPAPGAVGDVPPSGRYAPSASG